MADTAPDRQTGNRRGAALRLRPLSTRVMWPSDWALLNYFKPGEFRDPGAMGYQFMLKLDAFRHEAGVPVNITSDHRTPEHNKQVGGASNSAHVDAPICEAVDFIPANSHDAFELMRAAIVCGFERIGFYRDGSMHLDTTGDRRPNRVLWHVVSNPA